MHACFEAFSALLCWFYGLTGLNSRAQNQI
jgi:hypothetical protein